MAALARNATVQAPGAAIPGRQAHASPDEMGRLLARCLSARGRGPVLARDDEPLAAPMTPAAVRSLADIDALEISQIEALATKTSMATTSIVTYRILHDVLHESWHMAKTELVGKGAKREAMMWALLRYRDWHHQEVLQEVRGQLNTPEEPDRLKESKSEGSKTLTSDIDVNLKGTHTEYAVPLFNATFKTPGSAALRGQNYKNEPGVVYDVNVYGVDFMHKYGTVVGPDGHQVTLKEGARKGQEHGGISDADLLEIDRRNQLATALFKARLFMDAAQWSKYKTIILEGLPPGILLEQTEAFATAETRFAGYLDEMFGKIDSRLGAKVDQSKSGHRQLEQAAALAVPGTDHDDHHAVASARENVLMVAANRLYEEKLATIHAERQKLKAALAEYEYNDMLGADPGLGARIDKSLLRLRALIADAAMYANEASMTDATVSHVVLGLQAGKEIEQQKAEGLNAMHENLADVMKECGRYGPELGPAAFKSGKYMMRMADAAKNLGFGYIWGVQVLYKLGHRISEEIKKPSGPPSDSGPVSDQNTLSAEAVTAITNTTTLPQLLGLVMQTAAEVSHEYAQERAAVGPQTQSVYGHRTGAKNTVNTNVLNMDMVHPKDRGDPDFTPVSDLQKSTEEGTLGEFRFLLTDAEMQELQNQWVVA